MENLINDKCMTCTDGDRKIAALQLRCSDYNMERREKNARIVELETENARLKTTLERSDNYLKFEQDQKRIEELAAENAALRAQVPKVVKPVVSGHYSSGGDYHRCPECDTDLYLRMKYCHCGCKIDWSEVAP